MGKAKGAGGDGLVNHYLWLIFAALFADWDAYDGYESRSPLLVAFALLWAFAAGLHFAGMVMPA